MKFPCLFFLFIVWCNLFPIFCLFHLALNYWIGLFISSVRREEKQCLLHEKNEPRGRRNNAPSKSQVMSRLLIWCDFLSALLVCFTLRANMFYQLLTTQSMFPNEEIHSPNWWRRQLIEIESQNDYPNHVSFNIKSDKRRDGIS